MGVSTLWKFRWLVAANLYLVSPVLLYEFRPGEGGAAKSAFFSLLASVLWLLMVQLLVRRVWITHAVLFPLYLVVFMDLYVITNYHTRLGSTMLLTIVENFSDARAFLESDGKRIFTGLSLLFFGYGFVLWRIRELEIKTPRWASMAPLCAAGGLYFMAYRHGGSWAIVVLNDHDSPFGVVSQSFLAKSIYDEELVEKERAKAFHFGATRAVSPVDPEIHVLVIGESARRHNWSLYGYERQTNPELSKLENLIVFEDVLTQVAQTQISVPLIITRGSLANPKANAGEKSIVSVFGEVGFKTYWLSTQQRETAMASISRYTNEAEYVRFFEHRHDMVLVDSVKEIVNGSAAGQKMFFLLHTLGSHFNLSSRYPRSFAKFRDGADSSFLSTSAALTQAELIGAYDNTILYTDHVLSELVQLLRSRPGIKSLLYVPDHGDNLRDDSRELFGHGHSNEYDLPIPMLFWYSDEFAARYPEKVASARANVKRRLNTRNVFYSLVDMAGITLADPEIERFSVFGTKLADFQRIVNGYPKPFDFDEWMQRTNTRIPRVSPPN